MSETMDDQQPKTTMAAEPVNEETKEENPVPAQEGLKLFAGVPKVYDTVRKGAMAKVGAASPIVQALFSYAYNAKLKAVKAKRASPLWDKLAFAKLKAAFEYDKS